MTPTGTERGEETAVTNGLSTDAGSQAELLVQRAGGVATLTLNRPAARNALSSSLIEALRHTLAALDADDDVDVVVLTGTDPAFCAGLDLKELGSTGGNLDLLTPEGGGAGTPWKPISKPLIGAVNGVAVTGGLELALHCDILIASDRARFADTHARVGVMPAWGLTVHLPRAVGTRLARQMSLTGDFLTAHEALRAGLVTAVVAHEDLLEHTARIAATIAANDRDGVRSVLATYRRIERELDAPGIEAEAATSQAWLARGFDPSEVESRRAAIVSRGRDQTSV
jgi:enoyl-CoA hydratase